MSVVSLTSEMNVSDCPSRAKDIDPLRLIATWQVFVADAKGRREGIATMYVGEERIRHAEPDECDDWLEDEHRWKSKEVSDEVLVEICDH